MEMGMQNFRKMEFTPPPPSPPLQLGTWEYNKFSKSSKISAYLGFGV